MRIDHVYAHNEIDIQRDQYAYGDDEQQKDPVLPALSYSYKVLGLVHSTTKPVPIFKSQDNYKN